MKSKSFKIKTPRVIARGVFYGFITLVLIATACFGLYSLIRYKAEQDSSHADIISVSEKTDIKDIETTLAYDDTIPASDPYWKLITTTMIDADLTNALAENPDTAGWLELPGTEINYPFVQSTDNDYYLNHSFNGSWNSAGWPFLDFRNAKNLTDQNSIIYAHGRSDGTMFGSLKNVLSRDWQNTTENHVVKISTLSSNSLWQVFSVYEIDTTTDYLTTNFETEQEFQNFLNLLTSRSAYDFHATLKPTDKILTLSTCGSASTRIVLHAKLIQNIAR